jgi:hypothetical protein
MALLAALLLLVSLPGAPAGAEAAEAVTCRDLLTPIPVPGAAPVAAVHGDGFAGTVNVLERAVGSCVPWPFLESGTASHCETVAGRSARRGAG